MCVPACVGWVGVLCVCVGLRVRFAFSSATQVSHMSSAKGHPGQVLAHVQPNSWTDAGEGEGGGGWSTRVEHAKLPPHQVSASWLQDLEPYSALHTVQFLPGCLFPRLGIAELKHGTLYPAILPCYPPACQWFRFNICRIITVLVVAAVVVTVAPSELQGQT